MAKALKCDRCGKLYEHYEGIRVQDKGVHYVSLTLFSENCWNRRDFDLCPECMTKLVEFIKNEEEDRRMIKTDYEQIDKQEIQKSVHLLDLFTKTFCRYANDYERFDDLKFRCDECPFQKKNGDCRVKEFKNRYAPDYRDFGSMGDL